jgi:hypothetical protein
MVMYAARHGGRHRQWLPGKGGPASAPPQVLPLQRDIWITGTIQHGSGKYAAGDYTTILLDRPSTSPCNDKVVSDILLGRGGGADCGTGARHLSGFGHSIYTAAGRRVSDLLKLPLAAVNATPQSGKPIHPGAAFSLAAMARSSCVKAAELHVRPVPCAAGWSNSAGNLPLFSIP